jgi:hypothetical protein
MPQWCRRPAKPGSIRPVSSKADGVGLSSRRRAGKCQQGSFRGARRNSHLGRSLDLIRSAPKQRLTAVCSGSAAIHSLAPAEVRVYSLGYTRVLNFEETCSSGFLEKGGGYRRSIKEFAHFWSGSSLE